MASRNKSILPGWLTRISGKIYAIVALAAIGIGVIMAQSLYTIRVDLTDTKSRELQHLVETAVSTVSSFHKQAKAGLITQKKAQQQAKLAISKLRYDGKQYFWINDTEPKMVMHPFNPKLNGKHVGDITDPNGMQLFVEFSNVAKAQGGGIVNYMWPRPGAKQPQPKMAYVSYFAPWGWVVGTGTYIDDLDALFLKDVSSLLTVSLAVFAVIMVVSLLLARSLVTPIKGVIKSMLDIAAGRTNTEVPNTNRMDEIGQMAQAVLVFRRNASERQAMEEQETARKAAQEKERRALLIGMAGEFDANIRTILTSVNEASHLLSQQSDKMANQANENSGHVGTISSAMQQTSLNVEAVAGASEEMSASIAEISNQVGESARFSQNAVDEVKRANTVVSGLSDASQAIGRIVNLIQDIAEQTNLLALNATIEAARAGDAGKGFAVVASEVKGLASQTGKATEEIADQINTIQSAISDAVVAIDHVDDTIQKLSEISGVISIAVEEQGMAAAEISSNITQAAMGSRDVSDNTEKLHSLATDNGESAAAMSNETHRLQEQLNQLSNQVDYFIDGIQNGQSNAA